MPDAIRVLEDDENFGIEAGHLCVCTEKVDQAFYSFAPRVYLTLAR
jgi:hypothetical protein